MADRTVTACFGGTFDPPHAGHLAMSSAALEYGSADRVLFVPSKQPPHKPGHPAAPFEDRYRMTSLMAERDGCFEVTDIEQRLPGSPSYIIDTLYALEKEFLHEQIVFLLGGDSLMQLHLWHRAREIVLRWPILTCPRKGIHIEKEELAGFWGNKIAARLIDTILPVEIPDISSTKIRELIGKNASADYYLVPEVASYIKEKSLYRETE